MRTISRGLAAIAAIVFALLAYGYLTLPDVRTLKSSNPSSTAFMDLRDSEAHSQGRAARRVQRWVSYRHISPDLKRAVLVAEDDAFWQHEGVDFEQMQESLEADWARGRFFRGGSTITQQLAKNLYLSPSKNPVRKLRELIIARRLEGELKKARILELYL
ncbi:MAG TPA: biosynthetic peptidoglycan transglycosylase, partial [Gemmatimonadaceae bacterium]